MALVWQKTMTGKILDNVLFLANFLAIARTKTFRRSPCWRWPSASILRRHGSQNSGSGGRTGRYGNEGDGTLHEESLLSLFSDDRGGIQLL